jgi:Co/Zn/Cd efflux system component
MAHYRKPLAAAAALNTAIFVVEAIAGFQADSLSLVMDSFHNLSDEMALVFLYLAFVLSHGVSRHLLRSANLFNSVGLVVISALLLWQAVERILHPIPVVGSVAIIIGLAAAAANWASPNSYLGQAATMRRSDWPIFITSPMSTCRSLQSPPASWSA